MKMTLEIVVLVHALSLIVFLQYSCLYPRIDFEGGQWSCESNLGTRVANKVDIVNNKKLGGILSK